MTRPARGPGRTAALAAAAAVFLSAFAPRLRPEPPGRAEEGPVVRLAYRALQPGEPVLVSLESDPSARSAEASFLGRSTELRPAPGGGRLIAILGIDVQTKPGPQVLTLRIVRAGGRIERVRKDLVIEGRTFPSTKLQFRSEYVTPPPAIQARIKREAELVALAMSVVTPEWLGDGPFAVPHDAPSWSNFGQRRLNNNVLQSLHAGLDVRVPFGEPIRASNAGRVTMASDLFMGGRTVIIDHGLGVFSTYGHMSKLLVRRGQAVTKGQPIGLCGSTGRSTGPHLHWSFKVGDARVDPEAMILLPL